MHAVVRAYSGEGALELFDLLVARKSEVEALLRSVKGFVSYLLVRTADGGFTVSVTQDKAGSDETVQLARDWVQKNGSHLKTDAPTISDGMVGFQI